MRKVVDASVIVNVLTDILPGEVLAEIELLAPYLIDSEVLHAIRGLVLGRKITEVEADVAVVAFGELVIDRRPSRPLQNRIWALRHNLTAYDASYVALAEALDVPLVTTDVRIREASGVRCAVEVV